MGSIEDRLEYLRGQIEDECISYAEIVELQGLARFIDPGDVLLLEWAGVPEFDRCPVSEDLNHQVTDGSCDECGAKNFD